MLGRFIEWIRGVIAKMLHINDVKRTMGVDVAIGSQMQKAIELWTKMFMDEAPWLDETTHSVGLAASIASEIARLVTVELESGVSGSERAAWLDEQMRPVFDSLPRDMEYACAGGAMVFKPYVDGGRMAVDCVPAWRFLPTSFNSRGEVTGAVFPERVTRGKRWYTRMEQHSRTDDGYTIRNLAFCSHTESELGTPCSLGEVDEWADLEPELVIRYSDGSAIDGMLFAVFRVPFANNIDPASPLGVSVYSRAVDLIREADRQYSRILWEYEGSELAVDASDGALAVRPDKDGAKVTIPQRSKRLFRQLNIDQGTGGDLYKVFSPAIRDTALFNGFDKLLKRIEFNCSLAYGTLSDPQNVDKTAEEIRSSKQRSYSAVCAIQKQLEIALRQLVWIMDFYATLYQLAPRGEYELNLAWGDGVLQDTDKEYARRRELADMGYIKPEKLVAWYFGISEEEAAEYMPARTEGLRFEGE